MKYWNFIKWQFKTNLFCRNFKITILWFLFRYFYCEAQVDNFVISSNYQSRLQASNFLWWHHRLILVYFCVCTVYPSSAKCHRAHLNILTDLNPIEHLWVVHETGDLHCGRTCQHRSKCLKHSHVMPYFLIFFKKNGFSNLLKCKQIQYMRQ